MRSAQPGNRVVSTVISWPRATSRRLISWVRTEPPPAPGMAGSSNPRCSTRTGSPPSLGRSDATGVVREVRVGAGEQVVLEGEEERRHAAADRVGRRPPQLLGEQVGAGGAAGVRGVGRAV